LSPDSRFKLLKNSQLGQGCGAEACLTIGLAAHKRGKIRTNRVSVLEGEGNHLQEVLDRDTWPEEVSISNRGTKSLRGFWMEVEAPLEISVWNREGGGAPQKIFYVLRRGGRGGSSGWRQIPKITNSLGADARH